MKAAAARPRSRLLLSLGVVLAVGAAALAAPAVAGAAGDFALLSADVGVDVQPDGSLGVSERLEVAFSGDFHFGYRDIPLREGESLAAASVAEEGSAYRQGSRTDLSPGPVGTFGVARHGEGVRIVWYFDARDEIRAFTVSYTLRGVAVGYDDVVDVDLQVWGDQWDVPLGRLAAVATAPGRILRAWGKPVWVRGDVELAGRRAILRALDVPARQLVELRALVPRSAFSSTAGMRVERGTALGRIVAGERADADRYARDRRRIDALKAHPLRTGLAALALATLPALLAIGAVFWLFGRERGTGYDREYEQEPPTETAAALVPTLLRQGGTAGSYEFTATLFDLVRRGLYQARAVTSERPTWAGLRSESVADLELGPGRAVTLAPWEDPVADVVDAVLDGGTERLSRFRDRIEAERASMAPRFERFQKAVAREAKERSWFRSAGAVPLAVAAILFAAAGGALLALASEGWRPVYPRYADVLLAGLGACLLMDGALGGATLLLGRRAWRRRTKDAQLEAERWGAFRRYLADFPRLAEAPPATLELWERYLVYGIAFGIADRVLQGAQLHMPEALHETSSIYWISPTGDLGSGATSLSIGDLAAGFGDALAPPGSGAGGSGGGFSGWGGGGGGGFG